jgi:hypothetical protein
MSSIRTLVVSTVAVLAGSALFAGGCGGSAGSTCHSLCDKEYACGDIDSVKADQCRNKCDADADVTNALLDKCINKGDILSATSECLGRACSDYAKCLGTIPICKGGGTSGSSSGGITSSSGGPPPGSTACDQDNGSFHICAEVSGSTQTCPSGSTSVDACSTSGLLGTCTLTSGSVTEIEFFYDGGSITAAQAEQACASSNGQWSGA